jgi:hypothetical protein
MQNSKFFPAARPQRRQHLATRQSEPFFGSTTLFFAFRIAGPLCDRLIWLAWAFFGGRLIIKSESEYIFEAVFGKYFCLFPIAIRPPQASPAVTRAYMSIIAKGCRHHIITDFQFMSHRVCFDHPNAAKEGCRQRAFARCAHHSRPMYHHCVSYVKHCAFSF